MVHVDAILFTCPLCDRRIYVSELVLVMQTYRLHARCPICQLDVKYDLDTLQAALAGTELVAAARMIH